jgi:hypothetical protein
MKFRSEVVEVGAPEQNNGSRWWKRALYLLLSLVTGLLLILPLMDGDLLRAVYAHLSYYLVLGLFLLWGACLIRAAREHGFSLSRFVFTNGFGLLWSLLATVIVFIYVEPGYRVLDDETNLISISQSMTFRRTVDLNVTGKALFGNFEPTTTGLSKRPLLYPFFVHLLHTTLGYRVSNAFLMNGIALFGIIFTTYYCTRKFLGPPAAVGASLLLICQPVLLLCATSAGFEVFSLLLSGIVFFSLVGFLKTPNASTFMLFWIHLLAFAHTRYESPAFVGVILLLLLCFGYLKRSYFKSNTIVYALTPLLALPILWQRIIGLSSHETPPGVSPFGVDHLLQNTMIFLQHQLVFGDWLPYASAANLLGWAAIALIAIGFKTGSIRIENRYAFHFFVILITCLLADLVIHLAFHHGYYIHPNNTRYFIPTVIALSLAPVVWVVARNRKMATSLLAVGIVAVGIYFPVARANRLSQLQVAIGMEKSISGFLSEQKPDILLIARSAINYTVHNLSAVDFYYANMNTDQILMEFKKHAYSDIFVAQEISKIERKAAPGQQLTHELKLEKIKKFPIDSQNHLQISRVVLP